MWNYIKRYYDEVSLVATTPVGILSWRTLIRFWPIGSIPTFITLPDHLTCIIVESKVVRRLVWAIVLLLAVEGRIVGLITPRISGRCCSVISFIIERLSRLKLSLVIPAGWPFISIVIPTGWPLISIVILARWSLISIVTPLLIPFVVSSFRITSIPPLALRRVVVAIMPRSLSGFSSVVRLIGSSIHWVPWSRTILVRIPPDLALVSPMSLRVFVITMMPWSFSGFSSKLGLIGSTILVSFLPADGSRWLLLLLIHVYRRENGSLGPPIFSWLRFTPFKDKGNSSSLLFSIYWEELTDYTYPSRRFLFLRSSR